MPVRDSSNNRILPANARASDVAAKAIQEILPAQQLRNFSAIRVQGYQGLLYTHLTQGKKCTCQAGQKALNSRLGVDGKAKPGLINELLTGQMVFEVGPYGSRNSVNPFPDDPNAVSPYAPDKHQGVFDVVAADTDDYLQAHVVQGEGFGDNGPINTDFDIESLVGDWDASHLGFTDATCAICFGHGFVGGYSPFHAQRIIRTVNEVNLGASIIDATQQPWVAKGPSFQFVQVLPFGAIGVDVFRVMNNHKPIAANFTIDGQAATVSSVVAFCDGKPHTITVTLLGEPVWTHMELQFITSDQSAYFELPKLNKGSDTSQLEQLEPFNVVISSNVPSVQSQDIIVESTFGKTLIVQNSNWWNTRNRDVLGWECQVRVLQPMELFTILPKRGRILSKPPTPLMQHDNSTGNYRT
jgi:hypothetical protein